MTSHIELTDPRALRAYAHPIRMALLGLLRREGPKTATEAAAVIGQSVASCSFHLRQLARYGLIEEVQGVHGRSKPWRATAQYTSWRSDSDDPEVAEAVTLLDGQVLDLYHRQAQAWLDRRDQESATWRRAAENSDHLLYLTPAETRRLTEKLDALAAEFLPRLEDRTKRPKGSRPIRLITMVFPSTVDPNGEAS